MLLTAIAGPGEMALLLERFDALNIYARHSWLASTKLQDYHDGGMNVVFCDGSARHIRKTPYWDAASKTVHGLNNFQATCIRNNP